MLEDGKLIDTVLDELREIAGIKADPDFVKLFRHEKAIPQYAVGHSGKLKALDERLEKFRGLYITGNAFKGIGFNDCIENSYQLAVRILEEIA